MPWARVVFLSFSRAACIPDTSSLFLWPQMPTWTGVNLPKSSLQLCSCWEGAWDGFISLTWKQLGPSVMLTHQLPPSHTHLGQWDYRKTNPNQTGWWLAHFWAQYTWAQPHIGNIGDIFYSGNAPNFLKGFSVIMGRFQYVSHLYCVDEGRKMILIHIRSLIKKEY